MKLRLEPNLFRLRLSEEEVIQLVAEKALTCEMPLGPDPAQVLVYELRVQPEPSPEQAPAEASAAPPLRLRYAPGRATVLLSAARWQEWLESNKTGISADVAVGEGQVLRVVVERDLGYQH